MNARSGDDERRFRPYTHRNEATVAEKAGKSERAIVAQTSHRSGELFCQPGIHSTKATVVQMLPMRRRVIMGVLLLLAARPVTAGEWYRELVSDTGQPTARYRLTSREDNTELLIDCLHALHAGSRRARPAEKRSEHWNADHRTQETDGTSQRAAGTNSMRQSGSILS
jgi:hypothetical protein